MLAPHGDACRFDLQRLDDCHQGIRLHQARCGGGQCLLSYQRVSGSALGEGGIGGAPRCLERWSERNGSCPRSKCSEWDTDELERARMLQNLEVES